MPAGTSGHLTVRFNLRGQSGAPDTVTTGYDDNLDGLFSGRPAWTNSSPEMTGRCATTRPLHPHLDDLKLG